MDGKLNLIKGTRKIQLPSHSFYVDDLMVYYKGNVSGLEYLKEIFTRYALDSGQMINTSKSTFFPRAISTARTGQIQQLLNFNIGSLPFDYLGVPFFKGKPKVFNLQPVADKIKAKLSTWKTSLLSMAGRIQLVRYVIQRMLMYSIFIYSWLCSLIKDVEKWIRNFIWSGDVEKRKLITISWKKICRPLSQGGLSLRSLKDLNTSTNLNFVWRTLFSQEDWALLIKDRVFRNSKPIKHHIYSSLWSSMKEEFKDINNNTFWLLGNGNKINFWNDCWCGAPLSQALQIP